MARKQSPVLLFLLCSALVACQSSSSPGTELNEAQKEAKLYDNSIWEVRGVEKNYQGMEGALLVLINRRANAQEMFLFSPGHRDYSKALSIGYGGRLIFRFTPEDLDPTYKGSSTLQFIKHLHVEKAQN